MRGQVNQQSSMLMLMSPESLVPTTHPIRRVKALADEALRALSPVFDQMYSKVGRGSIPPERLLKASLLMALYSVRSERLFCEQLGYNLLFRWFFDMDMAEGTFDATVFSKNRSRLLKHDVAGQFFAEVVQQARRARLVSAEHFTVDGTLIEAWASLKSFRRKEEEGQRGAPKDPPDDPGNPEVDFHGEKRSNEPRFRVDEVWSTGSAFGAIHGERGHESGRGRVIQRHTSPFPPRTTSGWPDAQFRMRVSAERGGT
jgi:transposase